MAEPEKAIPSSDPLYQQKDLRQWRRDCGTFDFDTDPSYQGLDGGEFDPEVPRAASPPHPEPEEPRSPSNSPKRSPALKATIPLFKCLRAHIEPLENPVPRKSQSKVLVVRRPHQFHNPSWAVITGAVKPANTVQARSATSAHSGGRPPVAAPRPSPAAPAPLPGSAPTSKSVTPSPTQLYDAAPTSGGNARHGDAVMAGFDRPRTHPQQSGGHSAYGDGRHQRSSPQAREQAGRFVANDDLPSMPSGSNESDDASRKGGMSYQGQGSRTAASVYSAGHGGAEQNRHVIGQQGGFPRATGHHGPSSIVVNAHPLNRIMQTQPSQRTARPTSPVCPLPARVTHRLGPLHTFEELAGQTTSNRGSATTQHGAPQAFSNPSRQAKRPRIQSIAYPSQADIAAQLAREHIARRQSRDSHLKTAQQLPERPVRSRATPHQTDHYAPTTSRQVADQIAGGSHDPTQNSSTSSTPTQQVTVQSTQRHVVPSQNIDASFAPTQQVADQSNGRHVVSSLNSDGAFMPTQQVTRHSTPNRAVPHQNSNIPSTPSNQAAGRKRKNAAQPTPPESPAQDHKWSRHPS